MLRFSVTTMFLITLMNFINPWVDMTIVPSTPRILLWILTGSVLALS